MTKYSTEPFTDYIAHLPVLLGELAATVEETAHGEAVAADIISRAESFVNLPVHDQRVLLAPWMEEAQGFGPADAPDFARATTTLIVRNSLLEDEHVRYLHADTMRILLQTVTPLLYGYVKAAVPDEQRWSENLPFETLESSYPGAWAALTALWESTSTGRRIGYRWPTGRVLPIPEATRASTDEQREVLSGIYEGWGSGLVAVMRDLDSDSRARVLTVSSLSRISRNQDRLMYVIECLLARGVAIMTTNHLLRRSDVHTRRTYIQPDNRTELSSSMDLSGLRGDHALLAAKVAAEA